MPVEDVQYLLGHSDPRTTRLYDRREQMARGEVWAIPKETKDSGSHRPRNTRDEEAEGRFHSSMKTKGRCRLARAIEAAQRGAAAWEGRCFHRPQVMHRSSFTPTNLPQPAQRMDPVFCDSDIAAIVMF